MTQAEILPMETGKVAIYNPFRAQLSELKKQNNSLVFDYESPAGNKEARSYIRKLRLTKGAVEDARKKEKQDSLDYGRKVDAEAKEITGELEAMIDVHQKVVDEIEQREKKRVEAMQKRIAYFTLYQQCAGHDSSETAAAIRELEAAVIDDSYGEFRGEAEKQKSLAIQAQRAEHSLAVKREADAAELERLRKESAERARLDHEERIRREAAEKAKADAEATAKAEADALAAKVKADAERAERLRMDAEREKTAAQQRAQQAENARIAAEQKAKDDALAATEKAEREKQEAIQQERERAEAEKQKEAAAAAAREADKAHRAKINNEALHALLSTITENHIANKDEAEKVCKTVIEAIAKGLIPHIRIIY